LREGGIYDLVITEKINPYYNVWPTIKPDTNYLKENNKESARVNICSFKLNDNKYYYYFIDSIKISN
jgi:hypothetical protein